MTRKTIVPGIILGFMISFFMTPMELLAKKEKITNPDVVLAVKGLACPYCAFGLEKKLKTLDGVREVYVTMNEGRVLLRLEDGAAVSEEKIRTAVIDTGMTLEKITYPGKTETAVKEPVSAGSDDSK